jgi:hypothetical protein
MQPAPDTRRPRHARRLVFAVVATLAVAGSLITRPAEPAAATPEDEAAFVAALNDVRIANGLPPFTVDPELADLARAHAQEMADAGDIFHANPISAGYTGEWAKLGENVGVGANVEVLMDAFVASPGHFANIVDPAFTHVGVGVVYRDSALYTTHRFLQRPGDATPQPPTTTVPTTAVPTTAVPTTAVPTTTLPTVPSTAVPTTTADAVVPLAPPTITPERVVRLLGLLEEIGT